jgi:phage-related tail fiber protein
MTISSTTRKAGPFVGNDSSSAFPFAFKVFQAADVYVVRLDTDTNVETVLALTTDYTISLNADQNATPGGTVTLVAGALATGFNLTITSSISPLQSTDLTNQGGFYPSVITNALDKLTILIQQILERLGRSLTLPLSTPSNVSTALPFPEANKALAWNSAGTALANYDASQLATSILGSNTIVDRFTANGTAGPYTLSADPLTINNTMVFMGAAHQAHNTYSISGATITFDAPVASGTVIEVAQQLAVTYPVTALTPNVVDTVNIIDEAVTDDKIATGTITLTKLVTAVQDLINGALQKSGGTMTGKITLDGDATSALHAVTKQQLDALVPPGAVQSFAMSSAPTGWLKANGAAVSRTTYAALFAAIGTTFGVGDGSTTFNLPDLRGEFVRGWDDGRGVDTSRALGSAQADMLKSHTHDLQQRLNITNYPASPGSGVGGDSGTGVTLATGGAETRPRNVALLFCIKF